MRQAILIRVKPEDYEVWLREHTAAREARETYGITDGPFYRDAGDPQAVLVHLDVEDLQRSMEWFRSDRFKAGVRRAGTVQREFWIAEKRAPA